MGELRSNHWHMGLDIRTAQRVNQRVYAAADGYISYVGIRPFSYGRFIKITHPNGFTTLYGHLNDFNPALEKYVTEQQYKKESWAVELDIPKGKFPVKKGDFIAFSGTTGGSQGPHVHFEIRDTKTDKCLNPLLFGMPLADNVRPSIVRLAMYDRNKSVYEQSPKLYSLKYSGGGYIVSPSSVIKTGLQKVSFGISAYDRISGSNNQDGIYSAKLFLDGQLQAGFEIDSIDYDATRYVNAQIDYTYKAKGGAYIQHLSRMPGDHSRVYHSANGDGVIELTDSDVHKIRISVGDAYGNHTELNFTLQFDPALERKAEAESAKETFLPGFVNVFERPDFEVYIPEDCLYDTVLPSYKLIGSNAANAVSQIYQLNDETIPLHSYMTVRIKPDKTIPEAWRNKLIIKRSYRNDNDIEKAQWQGDWLSAEFSDFGFFQAFVDEEAPSVNELGKGEVIDLSRASRILFTPTDNFGIKNFRAELDGKWIRFTNDKGRNWIYIFDEHCSYGEHELKVRVEDIAGNVTVRTWAFKRYPYTPPKKVPVKKKTTKKK